MRNFRNILFVSQGLRDETNALKQALSIASNNAAELKVLVVCPEFPKEMAPYKERYEASLIEQAKVSIEKASDAIKPRDKAAPLASPWQTRIYYRQHGRKCHAKAGMFSFGT